MIQTAHIKDITGVFNDALAVKSAPVDEEQQETREADGETKRQETQNTGSDDDCKTFLVVVSARNEEFRLIS